MSQSPPLGHFLQSLVNDFGAWIQEVDVCQSIRPRWFLEIAKIVKTARDIVKIVHGIFYAFYDIEKTSHYVAGSIISNFRGDILPQPHGILMKFSYFVGIFGDFNQ